MATTYALGFVPKWYIADLVGRPLAGGYLATFSNLNKTQLNLVYQDSVGRNAWPYLQIPKQPLGKVGILFDENGSQGPFWFQFNSALPNYLYYLEVYDSNGNLQWTIDNYIPSGTGGSIVSTGVDLENLIVNNVMWRNFFVGPTPGTVQSLLASSAHAGLANNILNTAGSYSGPDIYFLKNNANATDSLAFIQFPTGSDALSPDVTPFNYFEYNCTIAAVETIKCVQFPITRNVQNLSNQQVTITIWAQGNSGVTTLIPQWLQFCGDGGGSSGFVITPIDTFDLVPGWNQYKITTTVPDVSTYTLGTCGNDALFLQFQLPLNALCSIDFTKPCMYLGAESPTQEYHTNDMIDGVINAPRTGNMLQGFDTSTYAGYIAMNDLTIGAPLSGATGFASMDTFPLYNLLWNNVLNTFAPVVGGRGASAVADFVANKPITLPRSLGRALSNIGEGAGLTVNRVLGEFEGIENNTSVPAHTHTFHTDQTNIYSSTGTPSGSNPGTSGGPFQLFTVTPSGTTDSTGSASVTNIQPTSYLSFFIKL